MTPAERFLADLLAQASLGVLVGAVVLILALIYFLMACWCDYWLRDSRHAERGPTEGTPR